MNPSTYYAQPFSSDTYDDVESSDFRPRRRYFPDTYLDSPIMVTVRTQWLTAVAVGDEIEQPKDQLSRTVRDVKRIDNNLLKYEIVDPDQYPSLYHFKWPSTLTDELTDADALSRSIYSRVSVAIAKIAGNPLPPLSSDLPSDALYWLSRWSYFDSLVEEFSRISSQSGPNAVKILLGDHTTVIATRDVWFLTIHKDTHYMLLYDQILMLKDLMFSRAQAYIAACHLYPGDSELPQAIKDLCSWHESCLTRYGNPGFEILKQTEALSKAYLSEMTDEIFGSDGPYGRMLTKVRDKERKLGAKEDCLADQFDAVLRRCTSVQTVVELFGLLKISGHPLIDARVGGISAAAEARSADATLFEDAAKLDWEFKRVMLESYIRKWGSWPHLRFMNSARRTRLYELYKAQSRGLNRSSYPLSDWQHCRFGKIVDFDYAPNYLELLDDKSISHYRTNIATTWDKSVKPTSHRRLLLELINREELDVKSIVALVVKREIPFDWLIVSLHPKEREFKIAPRMFSMLVLEIRIFFALTEANLADRIFPYLPQQTMTKSKIAIARQFLEMTKPVKNSDALRMFIEIDLSRWNLRWRAMSVNPVARTLNDMFDTPGVFDFAHEFFASSLILVRVRELEPPGVRGPNPPESDLLWYNHLGGFEGICQKLWTICTYSMVSIAVSSLPISYTLVGQGDNQVLSVVTNRDPHRPDEDVLRDLRDTITHNVATTCASVNQEVKVEECLESTTVVTYSKDVYVDGVYRPTALKAHSRLFPHSSQIFPSVRSNLGSIFATSVAGAEKSATPMVSYYLATFYGALYLYRIARRRGPYGVQMNHAKTLLRDRFHEFVDFCLTLPSEAGGMPVIPFLGFTYKGGSDPLGKSLASMNILGHHCDSRLYNRMLAQMDDRAIYNPAPKTASLLLDPFSIPLNKPQTSVDGVAHETITALTPTIKTTDIKELMSGEMSSYIDQLVAMLGACRPLNPLIMRDIMDCSVAGVTETVSKMFVATRTLQNVVRDLGVPVVDRVLHLESRGIAYMFNRFQSLPSDPAVKRSTYELTSRCRDKWFPNDTSPIVGLTTYQPTDFEVIWGSSSFTVEGINSVLVCETNPLETRGPFDPYVGSKTREKRSEHGYRIIGTDTASKSMRKLQLIVSQTGQDNHFQALIDAVGWTRTNTTLSSVSDLLPGVKGGTLSHRYAARAGHQDAFNIGSPNFATHLVISTDNMGYLSGGMFDYPHMIQEQVLFLNWVVQNRHMTTRERFLSAVLVTEGTSLEPLPSVTVKGPDRLQLQVPRYVHNRLAFLPSLTLQHVTGAVHHPALPVFDDIVPSSRLRRHVLEAYFKTILRSSSFGRQVADGSQQHFAGSSLDIAEVASNGLHTIALAIAYVSCDEAISNFMLTDLSGLQRWKVQAYASRVASELARTVSSLIGHPLLQRDPIVRNMMLYDQPIYHSEMGVIHRRYCGYVTSIAQIALKGEDTQYNHRTIGIFSSDNNRIASESLLTALLIDLYIWRSSRSITPKLLSTLLGTKFIPTIRAHKDEQDKVSTLLRQVARIGAATQLSHPHISHTLALYHKGRVYGYKAAIDDVLKSTRSVDTWGIPVQPPPRDKKRLKLPSSLPRSREFRMYGHADVVNGVRPLDYMKTPADKLLVSLYLRNKGKLGLMSGNALHTWMLFAAMFRNRPLIVVGTGMGAAARVALDAGCPHVYGIDLRSTIPLRSHRFRFYKPPLVKDSMYDDRYTQLPQTFTTSGDWFDSEVARQVLEYDPGDATIIIDIQSGSHRHGLEVLVPALLRKSSGTIMLRLYLTEHETCLLTADMVASGFVVKVYDLWRTVDIGHVVFVIQSWTSSISYVLTPNYHSVPHVITSTIPQKVEPHERAIALTDAVFGTVYMTSEQTVDQVDHMIDRLLDNAWGDYDSRLSYSEWSKWLHAKVVSTWLLLPEKHRIPHLIRWHRDRETTVRTAGGHVSTVKIDWNLCYHIATVVSRLV